jgi:hypothetical protein
MYIFFDINHQVFLVESLKFCQRFPCKYNYLIQIQHQRTFEK